MMEQKGELISFRPDIKVVDCTIRDGGLVNNFGFTDEFVKKLYETNVAAGVDYMEFGYKASKAQFDVNSFGKWKFCDEEDIRAIVGENNTDLKIAVMADVGRTDFRKDIIPKKDSVIDMIRIATYVSTIPAAVEMINYCHDMGYETTINIMAVSTAKEEDLKLALDILAKTPVDVIYLVDSYGSLYPEEIRRMSEVYLIAMETSKSLEEIRSLYATYMAACQYTLYQPFETVAAAHEEMINEYRRELFAEGQMFYVYKRTAAKKMKWNDDDVMTEDSYILPLPSTEYDSNK